MKNTGEQFLPYASVNKDEPIINMERYIYAMHHCKDKIVLDLGTGCGLGAYLYSLVAKKVISIDYNEEAIELAKQYPYKNIEFIKMDLEKETPPKADVCIAIEIIEHLENPERLMESLKCKELVFSVPMSSLATSKWHKYNFTDVGNIVTFFSRYYDIEIFDQYNKWIFGHGLLRKT